MCFTIYRENKLLHLRSMKTWNMYKERVISLNLFPTTSNVGVQIGCLLMNKLFTYKNVPLFLYFAIFPNKKIVLWDRTFESRCIPVAQRTMERKILQIALLNHTKNANIRKRTQIKYVSHEAQENECRWTGDAVRLIQNRWMNATTTWDPRSETKKIRYTIYDMKKQEGSLQNRIARSRNDWKKCFKC
jgi:hypothetical protein